MMFRSAAGALVICALATSGAWAAPGFTGATCDSPAFKAYILARLGHGVYTESGKQSTQRFNYGPIISADTVSNTGSKISCQIVVDMDTPRGTRPIHGRFTATAGQGAGSWRWQPGA